MADLVLDSLVDSVIGHVASLVSQDIGLAFGVKGQLEKLLKSVYDVSVLLHRMDKSQVKSEVVKNWLEKLKDVFYDADDLLDDFSTETQRRRGVTGEGKQILNEVRTFFSPFNQILHASKMVHRVMEIRVRIDAIRKDRVRFQLQRNTSSNPFRSLADNLVRPETCPLEYKQYVVGRDKDKKAVIEFLLNPHCEETVSVLPIVGLGGIGKTTLARLVFNDESVKEYFALKLWVCASTNFNLEDILRKIVCECASKEQFADLNLTELQKQLEEQLDGKRFLLVLDDMWSENQCVWLELKGFLMNGARGSKILVTTRSRNVALNMALGFHELRGLPKHESFSLLMKMGMKQEHESRSQNLEMIAKEILKKCAGVPLAIMTIGRLLLFSRNTKEDWLNFKNNDLSRLNQEEGGIMSLLKLSYDFLPSHLKQCFAYCSLFPKDYGLKPRELIHLWAAQGFIKSPGNTNTLEEVGHDYFMELLSRSFFQDIEKDMCGNIVQCKMHDLMHDLAQLVAGDNYISTDIANVKEIPERARHLSIVYLEDDKYKGFERDIRIMGSQRNRRMRSLLFIEKAKWIDISNLDVLCFRNLRALRLQNMNVKVISNSIGKLKHLQSLDLSWNYELRSLPNSMGKLYNLEMLDLRSCVQLKRLPRSITKLVNLRNLDVSGCNELTHMPRGIGKLTNLQMLGSFVVGKRGNLDAARLNELNSLTRLKKELIIQHLERLGSISSEGEASFLMEKVVLESLELCWQHAEEEYGANDEEVLERVRPHPNLKGLKMHGYRGAWLSPWVSQLHSLVVIEIDHCLQCRHLPPLDNLPFLKRIYLSWLINLEFIELSDSGMPQQSFFPSLEELVLRNLDKFRGWEGRGNMNGLEESTQVEEDDDLLLLLIPAFSDKIDVNITCCPKFSYLQGQRLHLQGTMNKPLQQLLRAVPLVVPTSSMMTMTNEDSLSKMKSLTIEEMGAEHLPLELLQSLPSLQSLKISNCPSLKALSVRQILRHLTALETLGIYRCCELDLSIDDNDDDDGSEGMHDLQLQGHSKLRCLSIIGIQRMATLPGWFQYFPNLEVLEISSRIWESEDQKDMPSLQFSGPTKLRELAFYNNVEMETLPWWIQHLNNLESLILEDCPSLKVSPKWFPKLTSLKHLRVDGCGELLIELKKKKISRRMRSMMSH